MVLHSTDLEVGVKTNITASVNREGEGLFPTSEINDIINVIEDGRVDIDVSGPHINIKSEKGVSFDMSTVPFQDYPEVPENKHETEGMTVFTDYMAMAKTEEKLEKLLLKDK